MRIAEKIKQFLSLFFLLTFLASCGDRCIDEDEFYDKQFLIYANPKHVQEKTPPPLYGQYNHDDGGQTREWEDTGLLASGDGFKLWVSGNVVTVGGESANPNDLSSFPACKLCFKGNLPDKNSVAIANCYCGPYIEKGTFQYEKPIAERNDQDDKPNANYESINCDLATDQQDINKCSCQPYQESDTNPALYTNNFLSFSKDIFKKKLAVENNSLTLIKKTSDEHYACRHNMGYGFYISLWGKDGYSLPQRSYHLFSTQRFCPVNVIRGDTCVDENGNSKWIFVYTSPDGKIFKKNDTEYHKENEVVKINFYDQFYEDNSGYYKMQFLTGVFQKEGSGLISGIVSSMEDFLFGYERIENGVMVKKFGIVEFMYKAVLHDQYVSRIINIGLILYVAFFGMAFLMGLVDMSKKELMSRLLKIALVTAFTNPSAWQMYNTFVVGFFKSGMDSIVSLISNSYASILESSYREKVVVNVSGFKAGTNFVFIDGLIKDLLSEPATKRIFSLFNMEKGKGFFAIIYVPAIYFLIFYFIYSMLDVAMKYIINIVKICIGLALGPVFIFFALFEKTKDMFKNWLAFMGSRSLEIVLLFALLHPFITIFDVLFKEMLRFKVCPIAISNGYKNVLAYKAFLRPEKIHDTRSIFWWFEHFLQIGAMIFIAKSIAGKSAYISGQLISIGGVSNADSSSEVGKGQSGFNMGSALVKGAFESLKQGFSSQYVSGAISKVARVAGRGVTGAARSKVFGGRSINDIVNDSFKAVGIRNRGLRSFMRDREVDKCISEANIIADKSGVKPGKDRDEFVRQKAMEKINLFVNENKNRAALLGLDSENIFKRMDQKLVKEPMKNFIKQEASKLKSEGKIGKEAEQEILQRTREWANKNFVNEERAVSEFFKKKSIKSYLNKQSNMDASEALSYVKYIQQKEGKDSEKVKDFVDRFRDATNQNAVRRSVKEEDNIKTGGVVFGAINTAGDVLKTFGIARVAKEFGKVLPNSVKSVGNKITKEAKSLTGNIENLVGKASNQVQRINPFSDGFHKSNPKKTLRKFDRKFRRLEQFNERVEKGQQNKFFNEEKEFLKIKKDDTALTKIAKFLPNSLSKPFAKIAKSIENRRMKKDEFQEIHTQPKMESYRRLAQNFALDSDKKFINSRKDLEQITKGIERLSGKTKNVSDEEKTFFERLDKQGRARFQAEINKKITQLGSELLKDEDQNSPDSYQKRNKILKLRNIIFETERGLDDKKNQALDQEIKAEIMQIFDKHNAPFVNPDFAGQSSGLGDVTNPDSAGQSVARASGYSSKLATQSVEGAKKIDNSEDNLVNLILDAHQGVNKLLEQSNKKNSEQKIPSDDDKK